MSTRPLVCDLILTTYSLSKLHNNIGLVFPKNLGRRFVESKMDPNLAVTPLSLLHKSLIIWDFDGVIKDSVGAKTLAYEGLFLPFGSEIARRVRRHHEAYGGMSRFEKIPVYLDWAGQPATTKQIEQYCKKFSQSVVRAVIESPWVPGVREFLLKHHLERYFVLVTATPQDEIEKILQSLHISHCFREIFGAPVMKGQAIEAVLSRLKCSPNDAIMIGDSEPDLLAARENSISFLLRRTPLNLGLQASYRGPMFDGLSDE